MRKYKKEILRKLRAVNENYIFFRRLYFASSWGIDATYKDYK